MKNYEELCKLNKDKEEPFENEELYSEFAEILRQIELYKISFRNEEINGEYPIKFSLFREFFTEKEIETKINEFNSNMKKECRLRIKNKKMMTLTFPFKIVYDFIRIRLLL